MIVPTLDLSVLQPQLVQNGQEEGRTVVSSPPSVPAGAWSAPGDQVSPQGPGDTVSLRDIMEQEKQDKMHR